MGLKVLCFATGDVQFLASAPVIVEISGRTILLSLLRSI